MEGKEIIKGVSLKFELGKVLALMGPNGSGKSTLAKAIMGHPKCQITKGKILLDGKDITKMKTDQRAQRGIFLSFQHPATISGVTISSLLRTSVNSRREKPYSVLEFHKLLKAKMAELTIDPSFAERSLNQGFSGGEKKKFEILQMLMLKPKYALLDETDSGLDVDAIKTVAEGINTAKQETEMSTIVITHYSRFLEFIKPDKISVLYKGKIIAQDGPELAQKIEEEGFSNLVSAKLK